MCRICEGFSPEDVLALDAAHIAEHGVAMQAVVGPRGPDDGLGSWVYTVGLLDAAAHPEFIIVGIAPSACASLLSALTSWVMEEGERFEVGDTIDLGDSVAHVGAVHQIQYELDTFATWHRLKDAGVLRAPEVTAVQITVPYQLFPPAGPSSQPVLANPGARVGHPE
jgi:hypothetical protein